MLKRQPAPVPWGASCGLDLGPRDKVATSCMVHWFSRLVRKSGAWPSSKDTGQSLHGAVWWGLGSPWWKIGTLWPLLYPTGGDCAAVQCKHLTPPQLPQEMFNPSALDGTSNRWKDDAYKAQLGKELEWHFSTRHMVCQPSIRQWLLQPFPSTPKSLGGSCEQLLCGIFVVHRALGAALGSTFLPGAAVPVCPPVSGSQLGAHAAHLALCSVCPLWCIYCCPRRAFACIHFLKMQAESILPRQSGQGTEMLLGFLPSA